MKQTLIVLIYVICSTAIADTGSVVKLIGTATFGGKPLTEKSTLKGKGTFVVSEKSYLKIKLNEAGTEFVIGANSSTVIDLTLPGEKQELTLVRGMTRWVSGKIKGLGVKTHNVSMGVRGTDFLTTYNPLLGETEVICFDGEVSMTNLGDPTDTKNVSKNQWGGFGGRFGKKLSEILTLSPELMSGFENVLEK